jgi:hypothetical protein
MAVVPTLSPAKAVVKAVKVAKAAVKEVVLVEAEAAGCPCNSGVKCSRS